MNPAANQRVSPNRMLLILALLLAVWLVIQFWPEKKPAPPPLPPVQAESKLRAVGLDDNPDWACLPELFAIWADKLEWEEGKTLFAYWHPGSKTYAYFFEAARDNGSFRFRVLTGEELTKALRYSFDEAENNITAETLEQQKEPATHPFVFVSDLLMKITIPANPIDHAHPYIQRVKAPPRVDVDISSSSKNLLKPVIQPPEIHDGKKQ